MGKLKVIKAGVFATIQDEGRTGYRQYGIPQSGAMDKSALHQANYLVGNELHFPAIEIAMQGITLEAVEPTVISLSGAETYIKINGSNTDMRHPHCLATGDILSISNPINGVYTYIGLGGSLNVCKDFGSHSTYTMAGFGGLDGRALKAGDILSTKRGKKCEKRTLNAIRIESSPVQMIQIIKGPEWSMLKDSPERGVFKIDPSSNRMGIRLRGEAVEIEGEEITSSAVIPGTIQLPSNGQPIILMNDCQTTGGYPRIGKVIEADLGKLAQIRAGGQLKFKVISFEEAFGVKISF